jgi:hypothetical protein
MRVESSAAMPQMVDRDRPATGQTGFEHSRAGPVLLATLSVRVDPSAERMAIDSALESRAKLILANMLVLPPYPLTFTLAPQYATLPHEEDRDAVRATADRAASLGIATELLRVSSPRPVTALLDLAGEREAGLLVFGPDLSRISALPQGRAGGTTRGALPGLGCT